MFRANCLTGSLCVHTCVCTVAFQPSKLPQTSPLHRLPGCTRPTFSPYKPTPTSLRPQNLPPPTSPSLNTSLPLFSTPLSQTSTLGEHHQAEVEAVSPKGKSGQSEEGSGQPRRVLFPLAECSAPTDGRRPSMDDEGVGTHSIAKGVGGQQGNGPRRDCELSFEGDFSLLDDLSLPSQGSHDLSCQSHDSARNSHGLQRYLVLECLTQERVEEEALLQCTGR